MMPQNLNGETIRARGSSPLACTTGTKFNSATYIDPNTNSIDLGTDTLDIPFGTVVQLITSGSNLFYQRHEGLKRHQYIPFVLNTKVSKRSRLLTNFGRSLHPFFCRSPNSLRSDMDCFSFDYSCAQLLRNVSPKIS
jgi:hypothetical protein